MNINLGLITIGNGNWKDMLKQMWNSLEIKETGYKLMRVKDEYEYKLAMDNKDLPSNMTNYDLHVQNNNTFRIVISMPVIDNYSENEDIVEIPWYNVGIKYSEASKICSDKIAQDCDYIVILLGNNLRKYEKDFRVKINKICVDYGKLFWEIGNDCECFNFDMLIKWIKSNENYCCYYDGNVILASD